MVRSISFHGLILLFITITILFCTLPDSASAAIYTCEDGRYRIWYPSNWDQESAPGADCAFAHPTQDSFRENINVISTRVYGVRNTEDYVLDACQDGIAEIRNHDPTADVVSGPNAGMVNGRWAATYVIDATIQGNTARLSQTIVVSEGYSYAFIITCAALPSTFNDCEDTFSRSINSFEVLNEPATGWSMEGLIIMIVVGAIIGGLAGLLIFAITRSRKKERERKEEKPVVTNIVYKPKTQEPQPRTFAPQPVKVRIIDPPPPSTPPPPPPPPPPPDP
jgi:hypothetical protein